MIIRTWTALVVFIYVCLPCIVCKKNYTIKPRAVVPENYVKEIRPPSPKGQPVTVDVSIYVVDINSINVEDMDFRIDMFVRQRWAEPRLRMPNDIFEEGDDSVTLPSEFVDNLWQPDPYILNAKVSEIAKLQHKFLSVTLFKNKTVRYAARMHAIIACQMEFQLYPMDIQVCPMYIESFSFNNQKLRLRWGEDAVTVNPELKLLQYNVGQPLQMEETTGYMLEREANFSRLVLYFRFERQIGHHLIQTFAPSALVVMLSWFSFWIGLDAIPGRVTLLVTSMLTLVTMFTGLKSDIPPVAYVKQRIQAMDKTHCVAAWDVESAGVRCRKSSLTNLRNRRLIQVSWIDRRTGQEKVLWKEIDHQSRIIFPVFFLLFVVFYWPILLLKKSQLLGH
ncbi:hypothetical protein R5R35_009673 [Gryllus longicercus]|uniref:Glycine receptor subunit alphaZ1 n=1 Tax=Gryllus longicercus TaxID=2509291 RepID=A0AAN9VNG4_9ORTH